MFVNKKPLVRKGDMTRHCGGPGKMDTASGNVVDGSSAGSPSAGKYSTKIKVLDDLKEQIAEWLQRVQDNAFNSLLSIGSLPAAAVLWARDETKKLHDPNCRGTEYLRHLAKCLPSLPPLPPNSPRPPRPPTPAPVRPRPFPKQGIEPVGVFDLENPITTVVTLPVSGAVKATQLGAKGAALGEKFFGPKIGGVAKDGLEVVGGLVGGLAG